jgi:hypothetical protein
MEEIMKGKSSLIVLPLIYSWLLPSLVLPAALPAELNASESNSSSSQPAKGTGFRLEDGTPVKLRLQRTVSSADAQVNDTVDFDVLEEVKVNDLVVIPKGSVALGTVTEAQPKRRMGRGGKLNVNIDAVRLADSEKAALRAVKEAKGGGHAGAMTAGIVATSLVFFPAAPLFLLVHGKDITVPKGTELTAYINGDFNLDPAKFATGGTNQTLRSSAAAAATAQLAMQSATTTSPVDLSTIIIKSIPDGADITADGRYVGSTPSTLRLTAGDHIISVERSAFRTWQRTISLSPGGNITINATLEREGSKGN